MLFAIQHSPIQKIVQTNQLIIIPYVCRMLCQLYRTLIISAQIAMLQKPSSAKLSTIKLKPISQQLLNDHYQLYKYPTNPLQSPRFPFNLLEDQSIHQTQKIGYEITSTAQKKRLPHLQRPPTAIKQNLLDLDLCFGQQFNNFCQTGTMSQRKELIKQNLGTPSTKSKRNQTNSTDSHDSIRLEKIHVCETKRATDQTSALQKVKRGKSESKALCRVVKSKKLPFAMRLSSRKERLIDLNMELDISAINIKEEDVLQTSESITKLLKIFSH